MAENESDNIPAATPAAPAQQDQTNPTEQPAAPAGQQAKPLPTLTPMDIMSSHDPTEVRLLEGDLKK